MSDGLGVKLTAKQKEFCKEYVKDLNATQAALRAGYSEKTAYSVGSENLRKPELKSEIQRLLQEKHLGADETKSIISTIAKSNVNKYLKVVLVPEYPMIKVPLGTIIKEIEEEIEFESEYASLITMGKEETEKYEQSQEKRRRNIIRLKLELKRNPGAFRERKGDPILVESTEFDMVALAKDKESGIIKSYKMTKDGPAIEFCSVDTQLANLARVNALFKDTLDLNMNGSVSIDKWLEDNNEGIDEG